MKFLTLLFLAFLVGCSGGADDRTILSICDVVIHGKARLAKVQSDPLGQVTSVVEAAEQSIEEAQAEAEEQGGYVDESGDLILNGDICSDIGSDTETNTASTNVEANGTLNVGGQDD